MLDWGQQVEQITTILLLLSLQQADEMSHLSSLENNIYISAHTTQS